MQKTSIDFTDLKRALATLVRNRCAVAVAFFLLWVSIFDRDDLFTKYDQSKEIARLEAEKAKLEQSIECDMRKMNELRNNKESLEKFAREEYYMKKDDEVIFIFK